MAIVTLSDLVLSAQRFADGQNTNTIAPEEWVDYVNFGIRQYWNKVNQLLQDYNLAEEYFTTNNGRSDYPLPDENSVNGGFMYVRGVDGALSPVLDPTDPNVQWMPIRPYEFQERGYYTIPRTWGYLGLYAFRYRIQGDFIRFLPPPVQELTIRLSYIPVAPTMLTDADTMNGFNGFNEYISAWAAYRALQKQELSTEEVKFVLAEWEKTLVTQANERQRDTGARLTDVNNYGWWYY